MSPDMHEGQLSLGSTQVEALVAEQFPELAGLPIRPVHSAGTVAALFRVGDSHVARFPLETTPRAELEREAALANLLAGRTPVPTPSYLGVGEPGQGYPNAWTLTTWQDGVSLDDTTSGSPELAEQLAGFVAALREIPTDVWGTPDPCPPSQRGGALDAATREAWVSSCLAKSDHLTDVPAVTALWSELRTLARPVHESWTHRDLMPGNVLVAADDPSRLAGVIDGGMLAVCDPAVDLMPAWNLVTGAARSRFREVLDVDEPAWQRGRAWALEQAIGALAYYEHTNPVMSRTAARTLEAVLAG